MSSFLFFAAHASLLVAGLLAYRHQRRAIGEIAVRVRTDALAAGLASSGASAAALNAMRAEQRVTAFKIVKGGRA